MDLLFLGIFICAWTNCVHMQKGIFCQRKLTTLYYNHAPFEIRVLFYFGDSDNNFQELRWMSMGLIWFMK